MNPLELISLVFNEVFLRPVFNLLIVIYHFINNAHIAGALGWSIILLTLLIRFLVWPFMSAQLRSARKMADLKPKLDELKKKHKDDKQAMSAAQMSLYKEHGINPAAGCVPTLIQFPVLIALYQSIFAFVDVSNGLQHVNGLLYPFVPGLGSVPDLHFLGVDLAHKPSEFMQAGYLILAVPLVTAALQFVQSRMMVPAPVKTYPTDSSKEKEEKATSEDTMAAVQSQMMYMMPIMIGYFAFQFPIALALYWNTMTIMGIVQQYRISGWGGLKGFNPLQR